MDVFAEGAWSAAGAVIAAFGGASLIVLAASSWLGKVWAARILEGDRARHQERLDELQRKADVAIAELTKELDVLKNTELRIHSDKLAIYRAAIDIIVSMLLALQKHRDGKLTPPDGAAALEMFEQGRLRLYGYLAMLAPQAVMDALDALTEYLLAAAYENAPHTWEGMRMLALKLLNEIRIDVGLDKTPIEYRGTR